MKIMVCIKQVPDTNKVQIDEKTGTLNRSGIESKINPYDAYALESALNLKQSLGAEISCITMGPPAAAEILREAFMMGADSGFLLTDRRFAGADVLATSRTLARGIQKAGRFDLIICGRQTTDGDTAQVGPSIAEHLGIPHISWVRGILEADTESITVSEDMMEFVAEARMKYPCLITVEKGINQPRLPSYLLMRQSDRRKITELSLADIGGSEKDFGLHGSPTQVERIFPPEHRLDSEIVELSAQDCAALLFDRFRQQKFV